MISVQAPSEQSLLRQTMRGQNRHLTGANTGQVTPVGTARVSQRYDSLESKDFQGADTINFGKPAAPKTQVFNFNLPFQN